MSDTNITSISNLFGSEFPDYSIPNGKENCPVGSFMMKPHKRRVVLSIVEGPTGPLDKSTLTFLEAYTPDEADKLADYIKGVARRARAGQSVDLEDDERDFMLSVEGFYAGLDEDEEDADV